MQEIILLIFLEKELFHIKVIYSKQKKKNQKLEKIKDDYKKFIIYIENESKEINYEFFKDYFNFVAPTVLTKTYEIKK